VLEFAELNDRLLRSHQALWTRLQLAHCHLALWNGGAPASASSAAAAAASAASASAANGEGLDPFAREHVVALLNR
jgi:hypothetical protein